MKIPLVGTRSINVWYCLLPAWLLMACSATEADLLEIFSGWHIEEETCNGFDDDMDGRTDEDLPDCRPGEIEGDHADPEGQGLIGEGEGVGATGEGEGEGAMGEGAEGEGAEGEGAEDEGAEDEGAEGEGAEGEGAEGEGADDSATCGEIFRCAMACPRDANRMACVGECMVQGDANAQALFSPLMTCVAEKCMEVLDATTCAGQQCHASYQDCLGIVADLDCPGLFHCSIECSEGDAACLQACVLRGTENGLAAFFPLTACVQDRCTNWSEEFPSIGDCISRSCLEEYRGCFPPPPCEFEDLRAPNHDFISATPLEPMTTLDGYICPDKPDFFKVFLAAFGEDGIPRCFRPPEDLLTYM